VSIAERSTRSRVDSEERLIVAAGELISEVGPRALSVRGVAERAGVNHGLVHHYFGGKDGLLQAAMTRLVEEHAVFAREQSRGNPMPAPLALRDDQKYLRAVVRSVLDDEMDLAQTELTAGVSVPRTALEHAVSKKNLEKADVEMKALFSIGMAMEMGWAALEPFIFASMDVVGDKEQEAVRAYVREFQKTYVEKMTHE
jgi:TetR/AcrR family transcriptional regulator, repressor for neighboring sulfatase